MIKYSLKEIELVIEQHSMDTYHKELMKWMVNEIKKLTPRTFEEGCIHSGKQWFGKSKCPFCEETR